LESKARPIRTGKKLDSSKERANRILELVRSAVHSTTALGMIRDETNSDPFKVLVSTILSARTRDVVTEKVSEELFKKYRDVKDFARTEPSELAEDIKSILYANQKAKNIVGASRKILELYKGKVPNNYDELLELPGVGRKTAGCVLVYGFGEPAIPVDVHVDRVSNRIGLVKTESPEETELELTKLYERKYWVDINELFVEFGKTVCLPVGPKCQICPVKRLCKYYRLNSTGKVMTKRSHS
jgi:endonuclease III